MVNGTELAKLEIPLPPNRAAHIDIAPVREGTLKLPDGRALGFAEFGASSGYPIIYCHGFPGSRLEAALAHRAAREIGARLIAFDRPGYGLSDIGTGRTIRGWTDDVSAAADMLGFQRFAVLGISGGCPYALACTHYLPERVSATGVVCGLGPLNQPELRNALIGPARAVAFLGWYLPRLFSPVYARLLTVAAHWHPEYILELLSLSTSEADRLLMQRTEVSGAIIASIREALRGGSAPVVLDMRNYARPWGFVLQEIVAPVQLWHGEADSTVPVKIGHYLAERLPNCDARFVAGEGHFSLPVNHAGDILRTLVAAAS